jgi:hypothetical protein
VDESVKKIQDLMSRYNVNTDRVIVDEDGVGGGVRDFLYCQGFMNGSKPLPQPEGKLQFANLKTQCYWKLAEMINRNELSFDIQDEFIQNKLQEELEWIRLPREIDTSKVTLLSKDQIKKKLGRSPDFSDALMMRMYYTLQRVEYSWY